MAHIDAHSHIWTDDFDRFPISPDFTPDQMKPPTFTPEELFAHCRPCGVDRVVLIQMSYYKTDNSYMLDAIARFPDSFRGVAIVDHTREDLGEEMERLREGGTRGFRIYHAGGGDDPEALLDGEPYRRLCGLAGELRMAVCPLTDPQYLPAVGRAAAQFPKTTFVVDHLGRVGCGRPVEQADLDALCALAQHQNCCVKVSAFYALGAKEPPHDDLIPLIRRVYDACGADRLMWATDCPYQVQGETYEDSIALVRDRLDFLSEAGKAAVLQGTAERVFFGE